MGEAPRLCAVEATPPPCLCRFPARYPSFHLAGEERREWATHLRAHSRNLTPGARSGCHVCSPCGHVGEPEIGITKSNHRAFGQSLFDSLRVTPRCVTLL